MAIPIAVGKAVGSAVGQVGIQLALEKAFFNKDVKDTVKNTENAFSKGLGNIDKISGKTFSKIGGYIKSAFLMVGVGAVTQFAKTAVNAASETQSAWTGLNSILTGTGKSFAEGKAFIDEYISDGLIPLQNAVTSYKNLASRGYSTEQIESTMLALKDAAAFGRQASYSYGEAIQSATEGLKNENSILVDNAGVTKNVAKMWDDYAASIGTTANNLTQQQKIQAEVNGILAETKFQTGDAAAYANTFAGKVARINTAFSNFKVAVGKFVAPIVELFLPYIEMALNALTRFFNKMAQVLKVFGLEMPDVVSKASSGVASMGETANTTADNIAGTGEAATKAAKKIKRAFASVDEINVLNTSDSSSGGGAGGGSSGGGGGASTGGGVTSDITEVGEVTEVVDSSASKIAKKLKELFEPLKKIDLSNLINAFDNLKDSIAPLTEKLFSGLEWLWYNILVPFATWTIEDAIPSFFNALAGALDVLNGVIDYAKPYLQFLWEEFLQPIASWTGGVIVDVLDWVGEKLSIIGKWLSDNAPTIESVREELSPFSNLLQQMAIALGNIIGLGWQAFSTVISFVWNNAIKPLWENFLQPILTSLWSKFKGLAEVLGGIFEAFNKLIKGDWKGAGTSLVNGLKDGIKEIWSGSFVKKYLYDPIKKWWDKNTPILKVKNSFETTKNTVSKWWGNVKSWWSSSSTALKVKNSFETTKNTVSKWWGNVKSWWDSSSTALKIKNSFSTTKSIVSGWWSKIKSWWGDRTLTISTKISDLTTNIKNWINKNFIDKVNAKLPDWLGKLPRLATGGFVEANNPRLAIIGDNKHEGEIVTPESKIKEQVVKGLQEAGTTVKNQLIDLRIKLEYPDGKYLIKEINNTQIKDGYVSLLI